MMEQVKVGQIVKLRNGGPPMTVNQILWDDMIECMWFDKDDNLHKEKFHQSALLFEMK
jgi:uncharacterized protein YodC (DUF2158 family)